MTDGCQAEALLPQLRRDAEALVDALPALREAFLGLAPRRVGSPALMSVFRTARYRADD